MACVRSALESLAVGTVAMLYAESLSAQVDTAAAAAAVTAATDTITATAIARHISVIAADSIGTRETPSPGLTQTARYIADQFQKFGLQPAASTWIQDYPIASNGVKLDYALSRVYCSAASPGGQGSSNDTTTVTVAMTFANDAYFAVDTILESGRIQQIPAESVVAVSGRQTAASVAQAHLQGHVVLYLPAPGVDSATERQVLQALYADNRVLVLSRDDSATFVGHQRTAATRPIQVINEADPSDIPREMYHWAAYIRPAAVRSCLEHAGADLGRWHADTLPAIRKLRGLSIWSVPRRENAAADDVETGVNVVGIVPGTGFASSPNATPGRERVLVISAHMDHSSLGPSRVDRSGAHDNASGVAILLELAHAFARLDPSARPHRPIAFLATSGEAQLQGITAWLDARRSNRPMMDVNLDMLGRPAGDSIWVDGLHDVNWPARLDWLATLHPELHLTVVDGGSIARPLSDHFAFAHRVIPSLYLYDDTHASPVFDPASPNALDTDRMARIAKLVFHLVYQLANEARQPSWTEEGRRNRAAAFDHP